MRNAHTPIAALLALCLLAGCGSAQHTANGIDEALNTVTDVVDPAYELSVRTCDRVEGEIIAAHRPEEVAQAREALRAAREACDVLVEAFEAVRDAQTLGRAAADAFRRGEITEAALAEALAATASAAASAKAAWEAFQLVLGRIG
jgi:hypothetical protein